MILCNSPGSVCCSGVCQPGKCYVFTWRGGNSWWQPRIRSAFQIQTVVTQKPRLSGLIKPTVRPAVPTSGHYSHQWANKETFQRRECMLTYHIKSYTYILSLVWSWLIWMFPISWFPSDRQADKLLDWSLSTHRGEQQAAFPRLFPAQGYCYRLFSRMHHQTLWLISEWLWKAWLWPGYVAGSGQHHWTQCETGNEAF